MQPSDSTHSLSYRLQLLQVYSEAEAGQLAKQLHKATKGESAKALPFVLQNLPPGSPFPPAPGFVKNILGPWVFWWKYKNLWKVSRDSSESLAHIS
jgi:hypothetical protein